MGGLVHQKREVTLWDKNPRNQKTHPEIRMSIFTEISLGEMIQLDEHTRQMDGYNLGPRHQLEVKL